METETQTETQVENKSEMTPEAAIISTPATSSTPAKAEAHDTAAIVQPPPAHDTKTATVRAILRNVRDSIDNAIRLLEDTEAKDVLAGSADALEAAAMLVQPTAAFGNDAARQSVLAPRPFHEAAPDDRYVEGVFDGERMVGSDGKAYNVPPNYASKSKLIEGDLLKLIIGERGNFIYKQIGPTERQRIVGALSYDQAGGQFIVLAAGRSWRVLKASVTYFKGEAGDEAVILVPKNAPSRWAAVENVIKRNPLLRA